MIRFASAHRSSQPFRSAAVLVALGAALMGADRASADTTPGDPSDPALAAEMEEIILDVELLIEAGAIPRGSGQALLSTLSTTKQLLEDAAPRNAVAGSIIASINLLWALEDAGQIDEATAWDIFEPIVDVLNQNNFPD